MKKILLIIAVIMVVSTMFTGCNKKETETQSQTPQTTNIDNNSVVGVWRHQDVPESPHYSTWVIKLNEDGTYTTESDTYESDKGKASHTEFFGDKGKYTLATSGNKILFMSDKGGIRSESFEIVKENGMERLVFKDSTGENKTSVIVEDKTYGLIFIKVK